MSDDPNFIPANPRPELSAAEAKAALLAAISTAENGPLDGYSRGERASWPNQLAEAAAFLGLTQAGLLAGEPGSAGTDLTLVPFLTAICAQQHAAATDEERLAQVTALVPSVQANAVALATLSAALIGIRRRADQAIDTAEDAAGRLAALEAARAEITALLAS